MGLNQRLIYASNASPSLTSNLCIQVLSYQFDIIKLIVVTLLITCFIQTSAQQPSKFTSSFIDSVTALPSQRIINNVLTIKNIDNADIHLQVDFQVPSGWKCLATTEQVTIAPHTARAFPLTIIAIPTASANWQPFKMVITQINNGQKDTLQFFIKTVAVKKFTAKLLTPDIRLTKDNKNIPVKVYVKNTGNITNSFTIQAYNSFFEWKHTKEIELLPGQDTIYHTMLKILPGKWQNLKNETIHVEVMDTFIRSKDYSFAVERALENYKMHNSAYSTLPLEIGFGYLNFNNQANYFGEAKGSFDISHKRKISFYFRSKQIGVMNQLQRNLFGINYISDKLRISLGTQNNNNYFITDGYGGSIAYRLKKNTEVRLATSIHTSNSYYKNDNTEATIKYAVKKIKVENVISVNTDHETDVKSYLLTNKIILADKNNIHWDIKAGVGRNNYNNNVRNKLPEKWGPMAGYSFYSQRKKIYINSNLDYYSIDFPGLYNGFLSQNHLIKYQGKHGSGGLFYQANKINSNFFIDTVYGSNAFSFNTSRYGVQSDWYNDVHSVSLSLGTFYQNGTSSSDLNRYKFSDFSYSLSSGKKFKFNINSFNGIGRLESGNKNSKMLWLNSSGASVSYTDNIGISGMFISNPIIESDSVKRTLTAYRQTFNISTFMGVLIFKKLFVNAGYNYAKSLYDSNSTSFISSRINYNNYDRGLTFSFFGSIPIKKSNAPIFGRNSNYFNVSLQKRLNVPVFFRKKYYSLKLIVFNDVNSNGIKDKEEAGLEQVPVYIDHHLLLSNRQGIAVYENIPKKEYEIDLKNATGVKGLVPANGNIQKALVNGSMTYLIPFKKSKVISGRIIVKLDSMGTTKFTPDGIKVTVTDSLGNTYQKITDDKGEFFFNLPANYYTVSLNPEAFNDYLKPKVLLFSIDLVNKEEEVTNFTIVEKARKVNFLKHN